MGAGAAGFGAGFGAGVGAGLGAGAEVGLEELCVPKRMVPDDGAVPGRAPPTKTVPGLGGRKGKECKHVSS